jgi:hypothetical protein
MIVPFSFFIGVLAIGVFGSLAALIVILWNYFAELRKGNLW